MKISSAFPSKYLKAEDVIEDTTYTIARVEIETLGQGRDAEEKPIVYFNEVDKGLALNKTNSGIIAKLYGDDTDDWTNRAVTLYATEVQFKDEMVLAIRIRMRVAKPATPAPAQTAKPAGKPVANAARMAAFKAFTVKTPEWTAEQRKAEWPHLCEIGFDGRDQASATDAEWNALTARITKEYDEGLKDFGLDPADIPF